MSAENTPPPRPFTGPELCALPAHEAVALLRSGEIEPQDLIEAALSRIKAVEPAVNAMPTLCPERALYAAKALAGERDHPGWLAGLPVGIKDLAMVEGVRTTFGTKGLADFVPEESDPIVTRIESRGGIVLGKTNTPEMGAGGNTFNAVFGRTRNPWDTRLNAGGSSGGAAVSLATGEVWLSHGSDLAGSLRTPAGYCGVVGLRPSPGVAAAGSSALRFGTEGVQGPMARSVRDCALFLDAMAGFDPFDPLSWPAPETPYQRAALRGEPKGLRIAYSPTLNGHAHVSAEMDGHLRAALERMADAGAGVEEACPDLPDLDRCYRTLRAMVWAAGPGRAPEAVQRHFKATLADNIEQGRRLTGDDICDAQVARSTIFGNMALFLRDFDVLACPVVGLMPGPAEEEYPREIDGKPLNDYLDWLKFSFLSTTALLPAIVVPVGRSADGIPVGIQLIGAHRGEAGLLAAAQAFETVAGGPMMPVDPNLTHDAGAGDV